MSNTKQFALRIEEDFYDQLVALADKEQRSLHGQITFMLKTYFDADLLARRINELTMRPTSDS